MSDEYFCSYMTFKGNSVFGYGDFVFKSKVDNGGSLLGNIKKEILEANYKDNPEIGVVITSLNKL